MSKRILGLMLFLVFVIGLGCLEAAEMTSVTFAVCNAGKADVDVFFSQSGQVSSKHVGSADCANVAYKEGAMAPANIGLAFTDSRGQWGAPRRLDLILDSDREAFESANQNATVKRGTANVTLPMQLHFTPAEPMCRIYTNTPMAQYPSLTPTPAQKARAEANAAAMATTETKCDNLVYTLIVEAYPDTKELAFKKYCDICEKKAEAGMTPEERAARDRQVATVNSINKELVGLGGFGGALWRNVMNGTAAEMEKQNRDREAELAPPMRVNWDVMQQYVYVAYRQDSRMKPVNQHVLVQGTIQSVNARSSNPNQIYDVYFKEDPKRQFAFCTTRPDIFQDVFGSDFASKMAGKTVEVVGYLTKGCRDVDTGVQITLARQLHVLGPGQAATVAHVWSPAENPIPPTNPAPSTNPAPTAAAGAAAGAAPTRGITRGDAVARSRNEVAAQTPPPATPNVRGAAQPEPAAAAPAPVPAVQAVPNRAAPAAPAAQGTARSTDAIVESVLQLLKAKTPEATILSMIQAQRTPHNLSGADRARLEDAGASEKLLEALANPASIPASQNNSQNQKIVTCQAQSNREFPNDSVARAKAFAACMQAK